MGEGSTAWALAGIALSVLLTLISKRVAEWWKKRESRRDFATEGGLELERANQERPWAEAKYIISELKEDNARLDADNDRLRDERDKALIRARECEIAAREGAAYLFKNEQLQQMLIRERVETVDQVDRLEAEILRLKSELVAARQRLLGDGS